MVEINEYYPQGERRRIWFIKNKTLESRGPMHESFAIKKRTYGCHIEWEIDFQSHGFSDIIAEKWYYDCEKLSWCS